MVGSIAAQQGDGAATPVVLTQPDPSYSLAVKPIAQSPIGPGKNAGESERSGKMDAAREQEERIELLESRYFEELPAVPDEVPDRE
jgi:hypothetical protein